MALISIVVPVTKRVNRVVLQCKQLEQIAAQNQANDFEFIFVDDGSHHESTSRLMDQSAADRRFRLVLLTRDFGATAAFLAGVSCASGDCVAYFPHSRPDPVMVFSELLIHLQSGSKIVLGRWHVSRSSRKVLGITLSDPLLKRRIFADRIYSHDLNCLLLDKDVAHILAQISDPYSDIIEILAWIGIEPRLVEYSRQAAPDGSAQVEFNQRDIALNYQEGFFSQKTMRTSLWIGFLLAALGVMLTAGLILASGITGNSVPVWWMFSSATLFMLGLQLILMGAFGEQIYKSLQKIRSRPAFVVDRIINPPVSSSAEGREKIEKMILSLWNVSKQRVPHASSISNQKPGETPPG